MKPNKSALSYSTMLILSSFLLSTKALAADTTPDQFTFNAVNGVPLNTTVYSNQITVLGIDAPAPISVTGGMYSINRGPYTSQPGIVNVNDKVAVDLVTPGTFSTQTKATLNIGGVTADYSVTTDPNDQTPDQFVFVPHSDVPVNSLQTSNPVTISGLGDGVTSWGVINGGEYSINGGPFTALGGPVKNGDVVIIRGTSSANPGTLTWVNYSIHYVYADLAIKTAGAKQANQFTFTPQTDVALKTPVTSNEIVVSGLDAGSPMPISISSGAEFSINGGPFRIAATSVLNNDHIVVRQTSSATPGTKTTATLTIGTVSAPFDVTTSGVVGDTTPDAFTFDAQTGAALGAVVKSNEITVAGIDAGLTTPITVTNGQYSVNGGAFTADAGTVKLGDKVIVQQTTSTTPLLKTTATLTIGGVNGAFDVTTMDADITPDAFTFDAVLNAPLSTLFVSNPITVSGINATTVISVTNGEYSIDNGTFTSNPSVISNGQTVVVRQTSSSQYATTSTATLTIGTLSEPFEVTTQVAPANVAPVLQSIPDQNAVLNTTFTYQLQASDANGDKLTFSLGSNAPQGASVDSSTGLLSWTPTTLGTFTLDVTVSDGTLSDTKTMTIIVTETPVVVTTGTGGGGRHSDGCDATCERYKEYRRKYKNPEYKELYFTMKDWDETNPVEFKRLQAIYLKYKKLSDNEISQLPESVQRDFKTFKHFNGYKHYRHLKEERHK